MKLQISKHGIEDLGSGELKLTFADGTVITGYRRTEETREDVPDSYEIVEVYDDPEDWQYVLIEKPEHDTAVR